MDELSDPPDIEANLGDRSQLANLVNLATVGSTGELVYLLNALEEAGIPCSSSGDHVHMPFGHGVLESRILVPREFLNRAREVVTQARKDAEVRGHLDAFQPENVEEGLDEAASHPGTSILVDLNLEENHELKMARLRVLLVEWLVDSSTPVEIARRLAVAGLTRLEAEALLEEVKDQESERLEARRKSHFIGGILVGVGGILWSLLGLLNYSTYAGGNTFIYGTTGMMVGFLYAAHIRSRPLPSFPKLPLEEPPHENQA
ncbi:MAG: DUF2007 domain-containing protein [Planctomycetota bacterium]|nr:DUF2007 domain-containing protein [Planctomycetota bacterium]